MLDDHVRVIQGDGIKYETLVEILEYLKQAGWSAENIGFGSGGGLLQKLDRDTQKFAFKCRYVCLFVCSQVHGNTACLREIEATTCLLNVNNVPEFLVVDETWCAVVSSSTRTSRVTF